MNIHTPGGPDVGAVDIRRSGISESSEFEPLHGYAALGLELVLYGIQSPINIGIILRIAEAYQFSVSIFDEYRVLEDPERLDTVGDFSCGALSRRGFRHVEEYSALERLRIGRRLVATSIGSDALPLSSHHFAQGDLLVLGNEYDGLPSQLSSSADACLRVPTPSVWMPKKPSLRPIDPSRTEPVARDGQPSLNVAVTAGILCYSAYVQWLAENKPR